MDEQQAIIKTLWLYTYQRRSDDMTHLIYALDEADAWVQARAWKLTRTETLYGETLESVPEGWFTGYVHAKGSLRCQPDGTPLENPYTKRDV